MYPKPKKSLGQNFLIDKNIQRKITASCQLKSTDIVLEIGAGRGELTQLIANSANYVYALEIDANLCEILKDNLKKHLNIEIINQDILKFDIDKYFRKFIDKIPPGFFMKRQTLNNEKGGMKVIGNIPYYIATPIIEHLLNYRDKIDTVFITIQKEFARRIIAPAGSKEYGSLSCFLQYYCIPKILFPIKKTCFLPPPQVDSCFLRLEIRHKPAVEVKDERRFFKIIRAAFNKRRKILRNSLRGVVTEKKLDIFFREYAINCNIRPESLTLENFANLAQI